jgi:hypothetical protein
LKTVGDDPLEGFGELDFLVAAVSYVVVGVEGVLVRYG